jgi:hypothetical protein
MNSPPASASSPAMVRPKAGLDKGHEFFEIPGDFQE